MDSPIPVPKANQAAKQTGHFGIKTRAVPGTIQLKLVVKRAGTDCFRDRDSQQPQSMFIMSLPFCVVAATSFITESLGSSDFFKEWSTDELGFRHERENFAKSTERMDPLRITLATQSRVSESGPLHGIIQVRK